MVRMFAYSEKIKAMYTNNEIPYKQLFFKYIKNRTCALIINNNTSKYSKTRFIK